MPCRNEPYVRSALAEKLCKATEEVLNHSDSDRGVKLNARLILLYVEGMQANLAASQQFFSAEIRAFLFPGDFPSTLRIRRAAAELSALIRSECAGKVKTCVLCRQSRQRSLASSHE